MQRGGGLRQIAQSQTTVKQARQINGLNGLNGLNGGALEKLQQEAQVPLCSVHSGQVLKSRMRIRKSVTGLKPT